MLSLISFVMIACTVYLNTSKPQHSISRQNEASK